MHEEGLAESSDQAGEPRRLVRLGIDCSHGAHDKFERCLGFAAAPLRIPELRRHDYRS